MKKNVSYPADMREKAKAEGLHLVTLDIEGVYAKKCSVSVQGYLFTQEEVDRLWEFMNWLTVGRKQKGKESTA